MLEDESIQELIASISEELNKGISEGVKDYDPSQELLSRLQEDAHIFSGFKTFHEMKEASNKLLDENGKIRPFNEFLNDVQKINKQYNENYLKTEYNAIVNASSAAAQWEDQQDDDNGRYVLQYKTAGDENVREEHRKLDNVTLPPSDPFWNSYYPPNGWGCRCTVVKVRAKNNPLSDSKQATKDARQATNSKSGKMFRFNPGKDKRLFAKHNSYTTSKCNTCNKSTQLARIPSNELCSACPIIQKCAHDKTKSNAAIQRTHYVKEMESLLKKKITKEINGKERNIGFRKDGNKHLYSDTFKRTKGLKKEDLKDLDKILENATHVQTSELSKQRKDNIKRFHYFKAEVNEKTVYLNAAETDFKTKTGLIVHETYVYSVTDKIKE